MPPQAVVVAPLQPADVRKPGSVWVLQAFALLLAGLCLLNIVLLSMNSNKLQAVGWDGVLGRYIFDALVLVWTSAVFVGGQYRSAWARWLALALLVALIAACGWLACMIWPWESDDSALLFGVLAFVVFIGLLSIALAFSARLREWFRQRAEPGTT